MLTKGVRIQLVVFAVLSAAALAFASLQYVGLPQLLGFGQYTVSAEFNDVSGLYPRALVSYRGSDVGEVSSLDVTESGVMVRMALDNGSHVPADLKAEIRSTSAIGEQYVDLVPNTDSGPYLHGGSVIPRASGVELPQIAPVLDSLDNLLKSVPRKQLTTLLSQVNTAFGGTGPALQRILDDTSLLVHDAQNNLAPTTALLANLKPFLATQQQLAGQTTSYVHDLASFTDQLRRSDSQIRTLVDEGTPAAQAVDGLVDKISPTLPLMLANLTAVSQVAYTYLPELKIFFVVYPATVAKIQGALIDRQSTGLANLDLKANILNPPPCISGYIPVPSRRLPSDTSQTATPVGLHCTLPNSAIESVRGARNDPCPNAPGRVSATPQGCGLVFSTGTSGKSATSAATTAVPYEPSTGRFYAPNGKFYLLGGTSDKKGDQTWQNLLTSPLTV